MILRDNDKGKPSGINGMTRGYESHVLEVTRICANSWESFTSKHIAWCWKSSTILSASDVSDQTKIYGDNLGSSAQDEAVAEVLFLMKQLSLGQQAKCFIDSDIASITRNDFCEWMDVESNINVRKGIVEDAMAEEE